MVSETTIPAEFRYWEPPADPAVEAQFHNATAAARTPDASNNTITPNFQKHVVHDFRSMPEAERGLDRCGFEFVEVPDEMVTFKDEEWADENVVRTQYMPKVAELVKKLTGRDSTAMSVSYWVRRSDLKALEGTRKGPPNMGVHVDTGEGPQGWEFILQKDLLWQGRLDEFDELRKGRVRLIQVWHPLKHAVKDAPLAMVDWRSLDPSKDCYPTKMLYGNGLSMYRNSVRYSPNHKWWSIYGQQPNEVLFFKGFDTSTEPGVARFIPHSAFKDPTYWEKEGVKPRESCEVRFWVFG